MLQAFLSGCFSHMLQQYVPKYFICFSLLLQQVFSCCKLQEFYLDVAYIFTHTLQVYITDVSSILDVCCIQVLHVTCVSYYLESQRTPLKFFETDFWMMNSSAHYTMHFVACSFGTKQWRMQNRIEGGLVSSSFSLHFSSFLHLFFSITLPIFPLVYQL